ncbi:MAG: hypothetical protein GY811_26205 [Myxococcales bacterium]|nr:hypothetical protein [Myxococcales bacterium]
MQVLLAPRCTPIAALLLTTFLVSAVLACGGASRHDLLLKDARAAEKRQAWLEAARLYGEACALRPKDSATCHRAQEMRDYGIEIRTYRARQLCESRRLGLCVEEFLPLLAVQSNKQPLVQDIIVKAGSLALSRCRASSPSLSATLQGLSCLQRWQEPLWRGDHFRLEFAKHSRAVAGQLAVLADSQNSDDVGARMSILDAASCIAPLNSQQGQQWEAAAAQFLKVLATRFALKYTSNGTTRAAPGTCDTISKTLGRGLTCEPTATGHALEAHAEVFDVQARWRKQHQDTEQVARYISGTDQVPNPDYDRAHLEYELAEKRKTEADRDMRDQERRCRDTESTADCDSHETLTEVSEARRRERDTARDNFHREPRTLTEDVYSDHRYVTREHEWTSPFRASIKLTGLEWQPEVVDIVYRDTEQAGFSPASVRSDPFEPPASTYFRDRSSQWLTERIRSRVAAEMTRRGQALINTCRVEPIECWARARYWNGETTYGLPFLQTIARKDRNAETAAEHDLRCTADLL